MLNKFQEMTMTSSNGQYGQRAATPASIDLKSSTSSLFRQQIWATSSASSSSSSSSSASSTSSPPAPLPPPPPTALSSAPPISLEVTAEASEVLSKQRASSPESTKIGYNTLRRKTLMMDAPPVPTLHRDPLQLVSTIVAGVGSGFVSSIICAPLDLVRTRMQVWGDVLGQGKGGAASGVIQVLREIAQKEGWQGWFRGLGTTLVTVPMFWGVYFPLYDETKRTLQHHYPQFNKDYPSVVHCGSAVMTGAIADIICNPLFIVRTRIQTEALHNLREGRALHHSGMFQTIRNLHSEGGGPRIFWRGMTANFLGLSHVAVQFPVYEHLKEIARSRRDDGKETPTDLLLASGCAKMGASLLSYPHEVLRSRMMDSRAAVSPTLVETGKLIMKSEGVAGLYAGLPITMIRVVPNCCITFVTYELLLRKSREILEAR